MKTSIKRCAIIILGILVIPSLLVGQDPHKTKSEVPIATKQREVISITPSTEQIKLTPLSSSTSDGPTPSGGSVQIKVQSVLPEWGAAIEAVRLRGPNGEIPANRIWVRSEETKTFQQLDTRVPIIRGNLRAPERDVKIDLEVRPHWDDPPGDYDGEILLTPTLPGLDESGDLPLAPPGAAAKIPVPFLHPYDPIQSVHFSLSIPEMLDLGTSGGELVFEGVSGPGIYYAEPDLRVWFCTNAYHWQVICSATNLEGERGEIPAEIIIWELIDNHGDVEATGNMGLNVIIMEGYGTMAPKEITLRFSLEITIADISGDYQGSLSVNGMTGF